MGVLPGATLKLFSGVCVDGLEDELKLLSKKQIQTVKHRWLTTCLDYKADTMHGKQIQQILPPPFDGIVAHLKSSIRNRHPMKRALSFNHKRISSTPSNTHGLIVKSETRFVDIEDERQEELHHLQEHINRHRLIHCVHA
jgi:hypothetical protein